MLELAVARARRRHQPPAGDRQLRRAQRRREARRASDRRSDAMPIAPPGSCRSRSRRSATAGSRSTTAASSRSARAGAGDAPATSLGSRSRTSRDPARPRQRAHASRALLPARTRCRRRATLRRLGARLIAARRQRPDPGGPDDPRRRRARRSPRRVPPAPRWSATSATRLVSVPLLREAAMRRVVFHELIGFNAPDPRRWSRRRASGCGPATSPATACASAWPRMRRTRCRRRCSRRSRAELASSGARSACTSASRPRRSSSCAPAAGHGARCSTSSARGTRTGRSPACGPVEYLRAIGLLTDACWRCTASSSRTSSCRGCAAAGATLVTCPRSNRWTGAAIPPVDAILRVRRPRRGRHRQPGERRRPERVRGAGGDPATRADVPARTLLDSATRTGADGARLRGRLRHDRAGQAGRADRGARPGRCGRCGRISGERNPSRRTVRWLRAPGSANP